MVFLRWRMRFLISILGGGLLGAIVTAISPHGVFWIGWLGATFLLSTSFFCLIWAWQSAGGEKNLAWMVTLAFFLRLGIGIAISLALPFYSHGTDVESHGYLFTDAFRRDAQAWNLASSGKSLLSGFGGDFATDQYGGLLTLSAGIYRYFSPDAWRPFLVLILAAFTFALGMVFLYWGLNHRWNRSLAAIATWIVVLYPDSIFFGGSQMREPFVIGLGCIAFWGILFFYRWKRPARLALLLSMLGLLLISSRQAIAITGLLALWFWSEYMVKLSPRWRKLSWVVLISAAIVLILFSWGWLRSASAWDTVLTERSSGWVVKVIKQVGEQWRIPFLAVYGLAQPVLPAAIAYPTLPLDKGIIILRAVGWYLMVPMLFYTFFTVWKAQPEEDRRVLLWTSVYLIIWLIISSLRAGGDQWDNPRYRLALLPWMALLAAWGALWALQKNDLWLVRWLVVEGIFLYYFTSWYFSRYLLTGSRLPFWQNVVRIIGLSALVLGSGWLWDASRSLWRRYLR